MPLQSIFSPLNAKPVSQAHVNRPGSTHIVLRDNFSIATWLLLGALMQGLLGFLPYRNIALVSPVALMLLYQVGRTTLQCFGLISNPRMSEVIPGRTTIVYPNETDGKQDRPGDKQICAILLGIRCNHPLGMFGKGFKEIGDQMDSMIQELDSDATEYGYLGGSSWISASDKRSHSSEIMNLLYFESAEKVHEYAWGPLHTKAMQQWVQMERQLPHIGLMHEIIESRKGGWEGVYANFKPTGLGATWKEVEINGKKSWQNPQVYAKGALRWSRARMGREYTEKDWPAFRDAAIEAHGNTFFDD